MTVGVLGVDLARRWRDNGTAVLRFRPGGAQVGRARGRRLAVRRAAVGQDLAGRVDRFVRARAGRRVPAEPQGWRDPGAGREQGAGRARATRGEDAGEGGAARHVLPRDAATVVRAGDRRVRGAAPPSGRRPRQRRGGVDARGSARGYYVLEAFPTSVWRATGLAPLPGKRARRTSPRSPCGSSGRTACLARRLPAPHARRPAGSRRGAAGRALLGAPARALPRGVPARAADGGLVEGLIWDAAPTAAAAAAACGGGRVSEAPLLVVVTGAPASGKTSVAEELAQRMRSRPQQGHVQGAALRGLRLRRLARGADRGGRPRDPVLGRRAAARVRRLRHRGEQLRRGDGRRTVRPPVASIGHGSSSSTAPPPRSSSWSALRSGSRRASATRATATSPRTSARCARSSRPASGIRSTSPAS